MKRISFKNQSGAVSLFVVVFATLLITVVTVSFLRLMVNDQSQASNQDLSQSAYDSAQAGIEDAKRALLRYETVCQQQGQTACDQLAAQINTANCNGALRIGDVIGSGDVSGSDTPTKTGEILVQQSTGANSLDQAYTCVTMQLNTDDYLGTVAANQAALVPLRGKSADGSTDFDQVTVEWFTTDDIGKAASGSYALSLPGPASTQPLLAQASWPTNRPSVLRVGLMQFGDSFKLTDFDATNAAGESDANTLFLYPTSAVSGSSQSFVARDQRKTTGAPNPSPATASTTPLPIHCVSSLSSGGYACSAVLTLPTPIGGGNRTAFLRLTPFYNATHFRVTLQKNGSAVQFNGVQPEIDSTGRANDLFRRLSSRVDLVDTSFPYPDGAVETSGNLCKDFAVTDSLYIPGTCTP